LICCNNLFGAIFERNLSRLVHLVPHHDMWTNVSVLLPRWLASPHHGAVQVTSEAMAPIPWASPCWPCPAAIRAPLAPPHYYFPGAHPDGSPLACMPPTKPDLNFSLSELQISSLVATTTSSMIRVGYRTHPYLPIDLNILQHG
jgi:hypothetical protein